MVLCAVKLLVSLHNNDLVTKQSNLEIRFVILNHTTISKEHLLKQ